MDGRDIGSQVLPNANLKFFLDASVKVRALRRLRQNGREVKDGVLEAMMRDIADRDSRDKGRIDAVRSLRDIIVINTDLYDKKQVCDQISGMVHYIQR